MRHKLKTDPRLRANVAMYVIESVVRGRKPRQEKSHNWNSSSSLPLSEICLFIGDQQISSWFSIWEDDRWYHVGLQGIRFFFIFVYLYDTNNDDSYLLKTYCVQLIVLDAKTDF